MNLLNEIEKHYGTQQAIDSMVKELNSRLSSELTLYKNNIKSLGKDLENIDLQIENTFKAFSEGLDPDLCNERLSKLKEKRIELNDKLTEQKESQPQPLTIDPQKAHALFKDFRKIYKSGTNEQKRILFKTFYSQNGIRP